MSAWPASASSMALFHNLIDHMVKAGSIVRVANVTCLDACELHQAP